MEQNTDDVKMLRSSSRICEDDMTPYALSDEVEHKIMAFCVPSHKPRN
jgi:hypothetical protein